HCDSGERPVSRGWLGKKVDEDTAASIEVKRDRNPPIVAQQTHYLPTGSFPRNREVSEADASRCNRRVNDRIAVGALNYRGGRAVNRVSERKQFEIAEMASKNEDSASSGDP